jgi:singapore isolate B (sub-type 7) whole genome shotgun sequence assembly, scaffold_9
MQLFQAAALGNENMQDVVREVLETAEDPVWTLEDSVKRVCYVGV